MAVTFLDAGIDVICDKPLTTTLADAVDLVARVQRSGLVFGVTHAFAAYPMVRQARAMVARRGRSHPPDPRRIRSGMADRGYPRQQAGRLAHRSGAERPVGCAGDIGIHAHHMATFVSGLRMTELRAELLVCGPPKRLDDTVYVNARYEGGVPGLLWATQVAPGNRCGLRLRIFGDKAGLAWDQENPNFSATTFSASRPG